MSLNYLPPILTLVGALAGLTAALIRGRLATLAAAVGWVGILTTAFFVQFGTRAGVSVEPIPAALAMAGSAALVVVPVSAATDLVRRLGAGIPALLAAGAGAASLVYLTGGAEAPWPAGALLIGTHWSALAAAVAAALVGALLRGAAAIGDLGDGDGRKVAVLRAFGRDFTARAVAFVWLAWTIGILVHWRFLGAPGLGSRSEWFGLGITLLATGGVMFGWSLDDDRLTKVRGLTASVGVAAVLIAGIWLSFGFGSPFQLTLGA